MLRTAVSLGWLWPVQTLIAKFLKDPSIAEPPKAVLIQRPTPFYSAEYTIGELLDNSKTSALANKYLPHLPSVFYLTSSIDLESLRAFDAKF